MPRIFISYRRDDAGGYAGWLHEHLAAAFGAENVFWDLEDIAPGTDFVQTLEEALTTCDALLALVGPSWLDVRSATGTRRLEDPGDFVRLEIATALQKGLPVIPVLLGGTTVPGEADLPDALRPLARCNAVAVDPGRFATDMDRLVAAVEGIQTRDPWADREVETNLPIPITEFVGREEQRRRLREMISGGTRLVTVLGPGGTGKTRLAVEVGRDVMHSFSHGVQFVDLAPVSDPTHIPAAIAAVLKVREVVGESLLTSVKRHLHDVGLLLILDNLEQVVDGVAVLDDLLRTCPRLVILATSRAPLRLDGEQTFSLDPLSLPAPDDADPEHLLKSEAVRLFAERASKVKPRFRVTRENAVCVAAICRQLDGLPLALELAAARLRLFPPFALEKRLASRLQTLVGGARNLAERQQTLRSTIAWSFDLLRPAEQRLLAYLSVFPAGCTWEAAEAVWDGESDLMEGLEALVDQSLLSQIGEDEPRFRMLETVREFAAEKLRKEDGAEGRAARYLESQVARACAESVGPAWARWLTWLDAEYENVRAALEWALGQEPETALHLVAGLSPYWETRGKLTEARGLADRAIEFAEGQEANPAPLAGALLAAGHMARWQDQHHEAEVQLIRALEIFRKLSDSRGTAQTLYELGSLRERSGRYGEAADLYDQALQLWQELGDMAGMSFVLTTQGNLAYAEGDYARAATLYSRCAELARELDDDRGIAIALHNLGIVDRLVGNTAEARANLEDSLTIQRQLGHFGGIALTLDELGFVDTAEGEIDRAAERHTEALRLHARLGQLYYACGSLLGLAVVSSRKDEHARAVTLCAAVNRLSDANSMPLGAPEIEMRDAVLRAAHANLTSERYHAAHSRGEQMPPEHAVTFALDAATQVPATPQPSP